MRYASLTGLPRLALMSIAGLAVASAPAFAQDIAFDGDLPRTMVFIQEEGRGKVASREMTSFLLEAGFSPTLGARPLKRAIERHLLAPLARTIVGREFPTGDQFLYVTVAEAALAHRVVVSDGMGSVSAGRELVAECLARVPAPTA